MKKLVLRSFSVPAISEKSTFKLKNDYVLVNPKIRERFARKSQGKTLDESPETLSEKFPIDRSFYVRTLEKIRNREIELNLSFSKDFSTLLAQDKEIFLLRNFLQVLKEEKLHYYSPHLNLIWVLMRSNSYYESIEHVRSLKQVLPDFSYNTCVNSIFKRLIEDSSTNLVSIYTTLIDDSMTKDKLRFLLENASRSHDVFGLLYRRVKTVFRLDESEKKHFFNLFLKSLINSKKSISLKSIFYHMRSEGIQMDSENFSLLLEYSCKLGMLHEFSRLIEIGSESGIEPDDRCLRAIFLYAMKINNSAIARQIYEEKRIMISSDTMGQYIETLYACEGEECLEYLVSIVHDSTVLNCLVHFSLKKNLRKLFNLLNNKILMLLDELTEDCLSNLTFAAIEFEGEIKKKIFEKLVQKVSKCPEDVLFGGLSAALNLLGSNTSIKFLFTAIRYAISENDYDNFYLVYKFLKKEKGIFVKPQVFLECALFMFHSNRLEDYSELVRDLPLVEDASSVAEALFGAMRRSRNSKEYFELAFHAISESGKIFSSQLLIDFILVLLEEDEVYAKRLISLGRTLVDEFDFQLIENLKINSNNLNLIRKVKLFLQSQTEVENSPVGRALEDLVRNLRAGNRAEVVRMVKSLDLPTNKLIDYLLEFYIESGDRTRTLKLIELSVKYKFNISSRVYIKLVCRLETEEVLEIAKLVPDKEILMGHLIQRISERRQQKPSEQTKNFHPEPPLYLQTVCPSQHTEASLNQYTHHPSTPFGTVRAFVKQHSTDFSNELDIYLNTITISSCHDNLIEEIDIFNELENSEKL